MANPQRKTNVVMEAVGDGLAVYDRQQQRPHVLNATSALVYQHCDGRTTPQQLADLLRIKFNLPRSQAEQLLWLALAELEKADLLQARVTTTQAPQHMLSRRQALKAFAAAGLSLALLPIVSPAVVEAGTGNVFPTLQCVSDNGDGTYTAHFGYLNTSSDTITIPYDPSHAKNMFTSVPKYRGQPSEFLSGVHEYVFSVVFDGDTITWMIKEDQAARQQVDASADSPRCPTTPPPTTPPPTTAAPPPPTTGAPPPPTTAAPPPPTTAAPPPPTTAAPPPPTTAAPPPPTTAAPPPPTTAAPPPPTTAAPPPPTTGAPPPPTTAAPPL